MKSIVKFTGLALFAVLQGCASLSTDVPRSAMNGLIIAEPLPVDFKDEVVIARLSDALLRAELTQEQRAELFYKRGLSYDNVGLYNLARQDFNSALRLKNDLADAYNFLGIQLTQLQQFSEAYEKFDSAIELEPEHEFAYFNRGIALMYGDRAKLAVDDLTTFYQYQANDPFRLLWLYFAEREVNAEQAVANLAKRAEFIGDDNWAKNIVKLYLGELSQTQFINALADNVSSNRELTMRLCEAYFYLGKFNKQLGNSKIAENYFKLSLATNVYEYVEFRYARVELDMLKQASTDIEIKR